MAEESQATSADAVAKVLDSLTFNGEGLIGAVAQQFDTGEVLMFAWMDRAAVAETAIAIAGLWHT